MDAKGIPIDADAFAVHKSEKYVEALGDIMAANHFWPEGETEGETRGRKQGQAARFGGATTEKRL